MTETAPLRKHWFRRFFWKLFKICFVLGIIGMLVGAGGAIYLIRHYGKDLPDYKQLKNYQPQILSRLYASDGQLLAEYADEKRLFVSIKAIPRLLINAFIAAEDKNFYEHSGIDFLSIARATVTNIKNYGQNRKLVGGSTITQQVVKNFLLTNEQSIERKIKEAILAFRISDIYSKDRVMELYLNEIYLGNRSYGVAAASLNYFNKSIDELELEEAALLAGMPKAPSNYDPSRYPEKALERRNYVLDRMLANEFITRSQYEIAYNKPITLEEREKTRIAKAEYFTETVRRQIIEQYGEKRLYQGGLSILTTLVPETQSYAHDALRKGLVEYDRRHGYRGPITRIKKLNTDWQSQLNNIQAPEAMSPYQMAVVLETNSEKASIGLTDGSVASIPLASMKWARKWHNANRLGAKIQQTSDVVNRGDVILVESNNDAYKLAQIPEINGAIVAIDPHNSRVLAMVGGYDESSSFNRAVQAQRQPGSAFKPFVYLAAMLSGQFTPASIVIDAEIEFDTGQDTIWSPKNYSGKYYGPSTLRQGIERSRNAMTVRLSQMIGLHKVMKISQLFDIYDTPKQNYSFVLGSQETNLLRLTNAYAMLVNGGKKTTPTLVEVIQNNDGKIIYKRDQRQCEHCYVTGESIHNENIVSPSPPAIEDNRQQLISPAHAYQMISILEGVVQRGTGMKARDLPYHLGGKTGTTNESFDSWFIGFSPDLVVGVYTGFDQPQTMGKRETGASIALPIFMDFMEKALKDQPNTPFRVPKNIQLVRIDKNTGLLPTPATRKRDIILEAFLPNTIPTSSSSTVSVGKNGQSSTNTTVGTGGLY